MAGRAQPLHPGSLDVNLFCDGKSFILFCDGKSFIDLDAEVPHGALDLGMAEQELHRSLLSC
jgi:hypothetical protein